jgi:hypothetical protein
MAAIIHNSYFYAFLIIWAAAVSLNVFGPRDRQEKIALLGEKNLYKKN